MTGPELDAWICKLRADLGADNGADYIRDELVRIAAETGAAWAVPSRSTINRVLGRHDLLDRNPAKRPRNSWHRFAYSQPRDCYQIDATQVHLADGQAVVVFDVLDDSTRTLVACHAAPSETAEGAIAAITKAFRAHGAPGLVLADNGAAFTSRLINPSAAPSKFTQAVRNAGSQLIHSSPYHPQTCGKVERHHQTLKKWLRGQHAPTSLRELQSLLDTYRVYYNTRRPHSALNRATPRHAWTTAPGLGGPSALPVQTDATVHFCQVTETGVIRVGSHRIGVGRARHGVALTAIRNGSNVTVYTSNGQPLGYATTIAGKVHIPLTPIAA